MQGRYFGDQKYYFNGRFSSKAEAKARVARLRREGNLARLVETSNGYVVYDVPKMKKARK